MTAVRHCHGLYELFCNGSDSLRKNKAETYNDYRRSKTRLVQLLTRPGPLKQSLKAFRAYN